MLPMVKNLTETNLAERPNVNNSSALSNYERMGKTEISN